MESLKSAILMLMVIAAPACAADIGKILFQDDFSDPASGWVNADLGPLRFDYHDGVRRIVVTKGDVLSHDLLPNKKFGDVSIEADATLVSGPNSSGFGLICRATAGTVMQTGYELFMLANGAYAVLKVSGPNPGQSKEIKVGKSDAIRVGSATNRLRADCAGNNVAFYANGQLLGSAQDADFPVGQVGFALYSDRANPGFEVHFDNFVVREAKP